MKIERSTEGAYEAIYQGYRIQMFWITEQHLKLIQRLSIYRKWEDAAQMWAMSFDEATRTYQAVPAVSMSRPYGNSAILDDIGEILGLSPKGEQIDEDVYAWSTAQESAMWQVNNAVPLVLQICCETQRFQLGLYFRHDLGQWHSAEDLDVIKEACDFWEWLGNTWQAIKREYGDGTINV